MNGVGYRKHTGMGRFGAWDDYIDQYKIGIDAIFGIISTTAAQDQAKKKAKEELAKGESPATAAAIAAASAREEAARTVAEGRAAMGLPVAKVALYVGGASVVAGVIGGLVWLLKKK